MQFTPQQQKVIDLREKNILVSAAAGSGKTAVLVERILGLILDEKNPVDIDRLLIVRQGQMPLPCLRLSDY